MLNQPSVQYHEYGLLYFHTCGVLLLAYGIPVDYKHAVRASELQSIHTVNKIILVCLFMFSEEAV